MKYRKLLFSTFILTLLFVMGHFAMAQLGVEYGAATGLGGQDIRLTIANIIRVALGFIGIIILVLMIVAGFIWMTSAGNEEKISQAKKILISATIGLAVVLSAFAVVSFVITKLTEATGFQSTSGGPGGGGGGLGGGAYVLRGISPTGAVSIRNVVVKSIFSDTVDSASITGNMTVKKKSDGSPVAGTITAVGSAILFTPSAACPAPNDSLKCFEADTDYQVAVTMAIKSTAGQNLVCGGFAPACTAEFKTGNLVDTSPPSVSLTYPNASFPYIYANSPNALGATVTDDSGISYVQFLNGNAVINSLVPITPSQTYNPSFTWDGAGLVAGSSVNLSAKAGDLDANESASNSLSVRVLAAHCNNVVKDADEVGVDCGGADCLACSGTACINGTQCASGSCVNGACVEQPIIFEVDKSDGASGNLVTIRGKYFGTNPGSVVFLGGAGAADDKIAPLASCSTAWTNTEIVVAVPLGAVSGPIRVVATNTFDDVTNDARGPQLPDFVVNTTVRPGICAITPRQGGSGDEVSVIGNQFGAGQGGSTVQFETRIASIVSGKWNNSNIGVIVPTLIEGDYPVTVTRNGETSNQVLFTVLPRTSSLPVISSLDPITAPVTDYVTVFGKAFGLTPGTVIFKNINLGDTALGDTNFPAACGNVFWHDNYIVVKVPPRFQSGLDISKNVPLEVRVVRADGAQSGPATFTVNTNPPKPGICSIKPDNGPIGTTVEISGERFGGAPGKVKFYNDITAGISYWNPDGTSIGTVAPTGAVSGPATVTQTVTSNAVNFEISDCRQNACGTGLQCCGASCIPAGTTCTAGAKHASYIWRFSTGPLLKVPQVVEQQLCDISTQSPSPWKNSVNACINSAVSFRFNVVMDRTSINTSSVKVQACGNTDIFSTGLCGAALSGFSSFAFGGTANETSVTLSGAAFNPALWYQVVLSDAIKSIDGVSLSEPYSWHFKTASSTAPCALNSVAVTPGDLTLTEPVGCLNQKNCQGDYLATPQALNCNTLKCDAYPWNWSLVGDSSKATLSSASCQASVEALKETDNNVPLKVQAATTVGPETKSGSGSLIIKFADPRVNNYWPNCTAACVNAQIGAEFNIQMNGATLNSTNVKVWECTEETCTTFVGEVIGSTIAYDPLTSIMRLYPPALNPNTYYRVRLSKNILSASGAKLSGLNDNGTYFTWIFKTKNDAAICGVASVEVVPKNAEATIIGQTHIFTSVPLGSPDSCSTQGQPLNPLSYNWNWSSSNANVGGFWDWTGSSFASPASTNGTFNFLPIRTGQGCTSQCLREGTSFQALCGNGRIDSGENCDDGNMFSGDGCSNRCLLEGSTGGAICGNGKKELGEACDDGNTKNGDGCSDKCLNEGSKKGGAVCGNGDKGKGEDCDDRNTTNGDGCSSICLAEGTSTTGCGNGIIEPNLGEQCDDSNTINGDGCSNRCLSEPEVGSWVRGVSQGICGNGQREWNQTNGVGEQCDDGNAKNGDGCSSGCLNEGSSPFYYNLYHQYSSLRTMGSYCGNASVEVGEDCDPGVDMTLDKGLDPTQAVKAVSGLSSANQTYISAATGGQSDSALYKVFCGATKDFECGGGTFAGVGSDSCCYLRPDVNLTVPADGSENICRNVSIVVGFTASMAEASFQNNLILLEERPDRPATCPDRLDRNGVILCSGPKASFEFRTLDDQTTVVVLHSVNALKVNTLYAVKVQGDGNVNDGGAGVLTKNGVGLSEESVIWAFKTGSTICKINKITVTPATYLFKTAGETASFTAQALATDNAGKFFELSPLPIYTWAWKWTSDAALDPITVTSSDGTSVTLKASNQNGDSALSASATITDNTSVTPIVTTQTGLAKLKNFLCLNPLFYKDINLGMTRSYNFSLAYCRDAGELGTSDDLPRLTINMTSGGLSSNFETGQVQLTYNKIKPEETVYMAAVSGGNPTILDDHIYPLDCSDIDPNASAACKNGDALGLRVMLNPLNLSPLDWYKSKGFNGNPTPLEVDGYEAIVDGRTVYIAAANQPSLGSTSAVFNNIYILSYSQGARPETIRIFNQILNNWHFNTNFDPETKLCNGTTTACSSDLDCSLNVSCNADLSKLRRNFRRITDLVHINNLANAYKTAKGSYPALAEGSFIRGVSISKWPSWQDTLGSATGDNLPKDPLNKFRDCLFLQSDSATDLATCWNKDRKTFSCGDNSAFYMYSYNKNNVYLSGLLETGNKISINYAKPANVSLTTLCPITLSSQGATCGNGILEPGEQCDGALPIICAVNSAGEYGFTACDSTCQFVTQSCIPPKNRCGNGITEPNLGEVCDDGSKNGSYAHCNTSCTSIGLFCGNSSVQPEEFCDLGSANGSYYTGSLPTVSNSCNSTCSALGPYCGDRLINGSESCDSNTAVSDRLCEKKDKSNTANSTYKSCASATDCPSDEECLPSASTTGICQNETNFTLSSGVSCIGGSGCPSGETCTGTNSRARWAVTCGTSCNWGSLQKVLIGQCGNGVLEPGEECDDANTNENDSCLSTCKLARCGDGKIETGVEECDQGANNGVIPTGIGYGKTQNYCDLSCKIKTQSGGYCGDGQLSGTEECDNSVSDPVARFGGKSCLNYSLSDGRTLNKGSLDCQTNCTVDLAQCATDLSAPQVQPIGFLDWVDNTNCQIGGWARDQNTVNSIKVQVVRQAPLETVPITIVTATANRPRPDFLNTPAFSSPPPDGILDINHGYIFDLPLKDGNPYSIAVYGVDANTGELTPLSGIPRSIQCSVFKPGTGGSGLGP